ncbi:MAG TPA: (2Fe-2S) ferredoxin domain-containing protein [Acidobacteriota bacterium]|nr:(2Fe-2S) ferredoxin domain-containing protein [Acidobacteriota bacterium]
MPRLSIDDLKKIREDAKLTLTMRSGEARAKITVHMGTCGIAAGARDVMGALLKEMESQKVTDVIVTTAGCAGLCSREPMATVEIAGHSPVKYAGLKPESMVRVLREHVLGGKIVTDYALASGCETTG